MIEIRGLRHRFGDLDVLDGIDLSVPTGGFTTLLGPSGCGKSTVLRVVAGLLTPTSGTVTVDGHDVVGRPGRVAHMPQRDLLLPWRRALANATVGAEARGLDRTAARAEAARLFERFGLTGFERTWPARLSGGMRQRVALLRTVVSGLTTIALDEPFGALDALTRRDLQGWLAELRGEHRSTVLLVTHDVDEALVLSDRVVVLSARPGRIVHEVDNPLPHPRPFAALGGTELAGRRAELFDALGAG